MTTAARAADGRRQRRAFIGSFTSAGGRGVLAAAVDEESGALTVLGGADDVPDPSYLALVARRGHALRGQRDRRGRGGRVPRDRATSPSWPGPPVPVDGDGPTHLCLAAGHVLTANYGSGSVTAVPVRPDGTLAAARLRRAPAHRLGPAPRRQQGPHAHQVLPDPSGRWVLSVDLGTDSVRVCALARRRPRPAPRDRAAPRLGTAPPRLPPGRHRRVRRSNELAPTVTVCRWDAAEGALEPLGETPVLPGAPAGDAYPSGIVVSPDGRFVWTATRGHGHPRPCSPSTDAREAAPGRRRCPAAATGRAPSPYPAGTPVRRQRALRRRHLVRRRPGHGHAAPRRARSRRPRRPAWSSPERARQAHRRVHAEGPAPATGAGPSAYGSRSGSVRRLSGPARPAAAAARCPARSCTCDSTSLPIAG